MTKDDQIEARLDAKARGLIELYPDDEKRFTAAWVSWVAADPDLTKYSLRQVGNRLLYELFGLGPLARARAQELDDEDALYNPPETKGTA